ncbi:Copper amine oxidase [Neofusicoccum parvum]|nr:Copper amine oxidase [Neofusicoccum parvum]
MSTATVHPFDPATAEEISSAANAIKTLYSGIQLHFKSAGLDEPPKHAMLEFLDAEHQGRPLPLVPRCIFLMWYIKRTPRLFEGIVDVTHGKVVYHKELPRDFHGPVDRIELTEAAQAVMADEGVQKEIQRLKLDNTTVVLDPWDYGVDGLETQERHTQVFMYMRNPRNNDPDSNHYAFPLDFMVIVDLSTMKVKRIVRLPLGVDDSVTPLGSDVPYPKVNPVEPEYAHHLQKAPPRTTLKPYQVVQPEGASFAVTGHLIEWEKWRFRVGFNWREGMTLHDLSFDGKSNFYRLSLSEMFVPYGDPRKPIYRKGAFDLGNVGAGVTANNLQLGCDCLGMIKYIDGCVISPDGTPAPRPNAICIHEVDNGIQWKHTNHRTGKAVVVRKRQLVLQTIITVANYEYIFAWYFDQSGELTFETRATGILSTQPIAADVKVPWGTRVADGVMAPYHQHLFNLRIDPAVGGHKNSFATTDSVAMPWDEQLNPLGTGYVTEETIVQRAGPVSDSVSRGRVFKILNESTTNRVSLTPIGYKLVPHRSQMLLAHAGTWHARRSEFATHPIWVTPYADRQLFPAGDYTNQGLGGHGIASWLDPESPYRRDRPRDDAAPGRAPVRDADIVVWHTYGLTHNPRVEDFPVMPAEIVQVHLKPFNFCEFNPANDVPPSTQDKNRSQEYQPPAEKGDAVAQGKVCCQSNL